MIKAVLFDLDGTLTKFNLDYQSAKERIIGEINTFKLDKFTTKQPITINDMLMKVQIKLPEQEFTQLLEKIHHIMEKYEIESAKRTELLPHARETLKTLKNGDIMTAVVTNNGRAAARMVVKRFELTPLINVLITREDASRWKPDGATVKEALNRLKVSPKEAIFVGDSTIDVLAAKDSNVVSVVVTTGPTKTEELLYTTPDYIISSLTEFPVLLKKLNMAPS